MADLPEVRRRALARFETPEALAEFLAARTLGLVTEATAWVPGPRERIRSENSASRRGRDPNRPLRVVDPTCGSGALLGPASRRACVVYGVDLDPAAVRDAARRLGTVPGGRVKVGNALLDPVTPEDRPAFVAEYRPVLARIAALRERGCYPEAERLAEPLRGRLAERLPDALRGTNPFCWPLEYPEVFLADGFDAVLTNPPWDKLKLHARECFAPELRALHESEQRRARSEALADPAVRDRVEAEKRAIGAFRAWLRERTAARPGELPERRDSAREPQARRGDANAYLAILELAHELLKPGGALGAIVPGGLWTDQSALGWRQTLFAAYENVATWGLEARTDAFPDIDQRTAIFAGRRSSPSPGKEILVHAGLSRLADLDAAPGFPVPIPLIRVTSPESLAIPPLADPLDAAIVEKLYRAGPPFAAGRWRPEFGREIDMTIDADAFDGVEAGSPLWEGKRIGAFELCPVDAVANGAWPGCKAACSRAPACPLERRNGHQLWVDEARLGPRDRGHARHSRVAWRTVARADRARRLEAALVPAGYRLGNSLNYLLGDRHGLDEKLALLALLNSLVVEWRFRQLSNNNNVNLFVIRQLPMPEGADPVLVEPARALMLGPPLDAAARQQVRIDLEARVARRFGLSAPELARILSGFPKLQPSLGGAIMEAFGKLGTRDSDGTGNGRRDQTGGRVAVGRAR